MKYRHISAQFTTVCRSDVCYMHVTFLTGFILELLSSA